MFNLTSFASGFIIGFGSGFLSREIAKQGKKSLAPIIAKTSDFKSQIYDKALTSVANIAESIEDFIADLQSEKKSIKVNVNHKAESAER